MQVFCTDGTTFECEAYELTDYGIMVYSQPHEPDEDRYAKTPDQTAYVPHERLWYILPDGVTPNVPGLPAAQSQAAAQRGGAAAPAEPGPPGPRAGGPADQPR